MTNVILFPRSPTFADWIRQQKESTERISDHLVTDLKRDDTLPATFNSYDEFRSYLISQSACGTAVRTAPKVWRRYRQWVRRVRS